MKLYFANTSKNFNNYAGSSLSTNYFKSSQISEILNLSLKNLTTKQDFYSNKELSYVESADTYICFLRPRPFVKKLIGWEIFFRVFPY